MVCNRTIKQVHEPGVGLGFATTGVTSSSSSSMWRSLKALAVDIEILQKPCASEHAHRHNHTAQAIQARMQDPARIQCSTPQPKPHTQRRCRLGSTAAAQQAARVFAKDVHVISRRRRRPTATHKTDAWPRMRLHARPHPRQTRSTPRPPRRALPLS